MNKRPRSKALPTALKAVKRDLLMDHFTMFEVRVIQGAMTYLNTMLAQEPDIPKAQKAFSWLCTSLAARAVYAKIPLDQVQWRDRALSRDEAWNLASYIRTAALQVTPDAERLALGRSRLPPGFPVRKDLGGTDGWLDKQLAGLPIYRRFRVMFGDQVVSMSLPLLTNTQRFAVYAIALMRHNQEQLEGLINVCPFLKDPTADYPHWFFDPRMDAAGQPIRGQRQRFCCPEHANAFRQREFRKSSTARKNK